MGIYGQDWASYQGTDPSTSGVDFAIIKATQGLTYVSADLAGQRNAATRAGLVLGFYHYPSMANDPIAEADHFLAVVKPTTGQLLVLDWEGYDAANKTVPTSRQLSYRDAWLSHVKSRFPHLPVGLYCNTDYWLRIDKTSNCGDFLWIATAGRTAGSPGIEHPWLLHQYSANAVDKDYCALDSRAALQAWADSFSPKPVVPPTPTPKKPSVSLAHVVAAAKKDPVASQGHVTYKAEVLLVERALVAEKLLASEWADGSFGTKTVVAYGAWERSYSKAHALNWDAADTNGIPGRVSLTALGARHGFAVIA